MKKEVNEIAKYVKMARKRYGLTQKEFAFQAGVGLRFLRKLEQGDCSIMLDKVFQVLNALGSKLVVEEIKK